MPHAWVIVDGYSWIHRIPEFRALGHGEVARQRLVRFLEAQVGEIADRITVVFDGQQEGLAEDSPIVQVLYSPAHQTADTVIERLVVAAPDRSEILVVTSDIQERRTIEAAGARSMSCTDFLHLCANRPKKDKPPQMGAQTSDFKITLGDLLPPDAIREQDS